MATTLQQVPVSFVGGQQSVSFSVDSIRLLSWVTDESDYIDNTEKSECQELSKKDRLVKEDGWDRWR
jgi:hypothetical protein